MRKIYNKNAREKALLEEAYGAVYERTLDPYDKQGEELAPEVMFNPRAEEEASDISGERWSEEYDIKEVTTTDDLQYAHQGDAFLFDKVDVFAQAEGEVIETESDVMDFLSDFGDWELKDNPYGAIVVKVGDILDDPPLAGRDAEELF